MWNVLQAALRALLLEALLGQQCDMVSFSQGDDSQHLKYVLKLSISRVLTAKAPTESEAGVDSYALTEYFWGLAY